MKVSQIFLGSGELSAVLSPALVLPHSKKPLGPGLEVAGAGPLGAEFACSPCVCSGFLLQSKDVQSVCQMG